MQNYKIFTNVNSTR